MLAARCSLLAAAVWSFGADSLARVTCRLCQRRGSGWLDDREPRSRGLAVAVAGLRQLAYGASSYSMGLVCEASCFVYDTIHVHSHQSE